MIDEYLNISQEDLSDSDEYKRLIDILGQEQVRSVMVKWVELLKEYQKYWLNLPFN